MIKKRTILYFVSLLISAATVGQTETRPDPFLKFDNYTRKDGLSDNIIRDILQDSRGFIWIATSSGLNRFDGYTFKTYFHDPSDNSSISDNLITCLAEDSDGRLWIGTKNGLNCYQSNSNTFVRHFQDDKNDNSLYDNHVRALLSDEGRLWVETAGGCLHDFDLNSDTVKRYMHSAPGMANTYFYHTIYKDSEGKIWVGGRYMGIYRFDPANEELLRIIEDPNDKTKKRDSDVACYFEQTDGTFWVSGIDGLYTYDRNNDLFTKYLPVSTFSIRPDADSRLWIGTGNGIYLLYKDRNEFIHLIHNDNNSNSLVHDHVNKIFTDNSGNIWIGTNQGISVFRPSKNKFRHIYHIPEIKNSPVSNHITCLLHDREGRLWIGTANAGLACYDMDFNLLFSYSTESEYPFRIVSNKVSTLMEDRDGDIWAGLWSGRGFHIVNPDKESNEHHVLHAGSLRGDWYNDFMQDSERNTWVAIWGAQGLYKFDKPRKTFTDDRFVSLFPTLKQPVHGLAHDGEYIWLATGNVRRFVCIDPDIPRYNTYGRDNYESYDFTGIIDVFSDKGGKAWFETDSGYYFKYPGPYTTIRKISKVEYKAAQKRFDHKAAEATEGIYTASVVDGSGVTWAGSYSGLYKISGDSAVRAFRHSTGDETTLVSDTVLALDFFPPDELWIGTNMGICMLHIPTETMTPFNKAGDSDLSSHLTSFVFEDSHGFIWVGTTNAGVNKLDPGSRHIRKFLPDFTVNGAFWGDEATCITEDSRGIIWIGGYGINRYNPDDNTFIHFTASDGLAGNKINGILEDDNGMLWIATNSGLSLFDFSDQSFQNFYARDGLQGEEFSKACCKTRDGLLLFGGGNGITVVDPDRVVFNRHVPSVAVTSFKLFEQEMPMLFDESGTLVFKHDQNYFSFGFSALDFSDPAHNLFAYKLVNFDEEWIETDASNRVARYTNVGPGHYVLNIKAANNDGNWNQEGLSIPIRITPPFWRSAWFYILEAMLAVSMVILIIKYRERKIKEKNRVITLEQRLLRSQMNPHFIFNSLSSIQSFIFENNPIEAGSYLSKFADLVRSILYNSREEFIPFEKELQTLTNYLELQELRYENKFTHVIDADPAIDPESVMIPPMMAQPFIENSIEHGFRNLNRKGWIRISFTLLEDAILIEIGDNGIGLRASGKNSQQKRSSHHSLATVITRERINAFNKGKKQQKFSIHVSELTSDDGRPAGTLVKLVIPFMQT